MSHQETLSPNEQDSLGVKLKKGIVWQYLQTLFVTIFNFATGIVLARLLSPSDFGLFAAVTAITSLLLIQVNFGWAETILRAKTLDKQMLNTIFWLMEAAAFLLMVGIIASSFWLGRFYEDDRFASVMILSGSIFFIVPFNAINGSLLRWRMRYDLISRISMIVTVLSTTLGITLAYFGMGVYSLVITGLSSSLLLTGIMAYFAPWRPSLTFSFEAIRPHFDFTWRLHLNNSLSMLSSRIDNMMIGKLSGIKELGIYVKAFSLGRMPVDLLGGNLYQMFFTALSHTRDNRSDSLMLFQKMIAAMSFAIYLPLLVLFLVGEGFVFHLYGEKWMAAVLPMQIMLIGSFASVISMTCGAFCDANNLVKKETPIICIGVVLTIVAVVGGSRWGLVGISTGIAIKTFINLFLIKNVLTQGLHLKWKDLWKPTWPNICATAVGFIASGIPYYLLKNSYTGRDLVYMASLSGTATIGYVLTWLFLAVRLKNNAEIQTLLETGKSILKRVYNK